MNSNTVVIKSGDFRRKTIPVSGLTAFVINFIQEPEILKSFVAITNFFKFITKLHCSFDPHEFTVMYILLKIEFHSKCCKCLHAGVS